MRNWRNLVILAIGILLILASFIVYGVRVSHTIIPADASASEIEQLTTRYGLDRPLAIQFAAFLVLFLSGLTVVAVYGIAGIRRLESPLFILAKAFLLLMLISNGITVLNYSLWAPLTNPFVTIDFYLKMVLVALALLNFTFILVIWNGRKWGFWGFAVASFISFIFVLLGHVPVIPSIFGVSAPLILYFLIRISWNDMR